MKTASTVKTLTMLGLASLALVAGSSQADNGYPYYGGNPNYGAYQNANPWLAGQVSPQMNYQVHLRGRVAQLDQRQDAQLQRILGGMEQGKLTMRESVDLLREHLAISALERKYLADGRLGPNELNNLEQRLEEANRHIVFEKNDREQQRDQPGRPGDWGRR